MHGVILISTIILPVHAVYPTVQYLPTYFFRNISGTAKKIVTRDDDFNSTRRPGWIAANSEKARPGPMGRAKAVWKRKICPAQRHT